MLISTLSTVSKQLTIYFGIATLVTGLIDGILNIIIFISLKMISSTIRLYCLWYY